MITYVFSQSSYPRTILWENDTLLAITKEQLVTINRSLNDLEYLQKSTQVLKRDIVLSDSLCTYWKNSYLLKDSINKIQNEQFKKTVVLNEQLNVALSEQKKKNRTTALSVGVGGTLIGVLLGLILK